MCDIENVYRTVTIGGNLFEAPTKLIGEQVVLLFHEHKPNRVEIVYKGESHGFLVPVDVQVNSQVKRERDYDEIVVDGRIHKQGLLPFVARR